MIKVCRHTWGCIHDDKGVSSYMGFIQDDKGDKGFIAISYAVYGDRETCSVVCVIIALYVYFRYQNNHSLFRAPSHVTMNFRLNLICVLNNVMSCFS